MKTGFHATVRCYANLHGGKQTIILPCSYTYESQWLAWHKDKMTQGYSSSGVTLAVTNSSLIRLKTPQQEGNHTWYWKPRQLLRAGEVMDLRREPIATTLLNLHNPKAHFKYLSLYSQIQSSPLIRKLFVTHKDPLQKTTTNQNQSHGAQSQLMYLYHNSCIYSSGTFGGKGAQRL